MNTCADFCTAAKCDELEARIASLEQALALLEAAFEAHTNQDVYEGHNFSPTITINHEFHDFVLLTNLTFDSTNVDAYVDLNSLLISSFDIGIYELGDNFFDLGMSINGIVRTTQFQVETDEHIVSNLAINGSFEGNYLNLTVADGESEATAQIYFNALTGDEHVVSNLVIDGIHQGDYLYLTVADGESVGTATIYLDSTTIINSGGGGDLGCEQTEQKIDDCCAELAALINNVSIQVSDMQNIITAEIDDSESKLINEIDASEIAINSKIQAVEDYVTIDISGEVNSEYQCEEPTAENNNITSSFTPINYTGIGLAGIHENLKLINTNLDSIFAATCEIETTDVDVVNVLPSPNVLTNFDDKVLILHFVTLDNYPKRSRGSNYREIQIPGAKDSYDWDSDFKELYWEQGDQFGELILNEYKAAVSGWFKDKNAANIYFDKVLTLTRGTQKDRNLPDRLNNRTDIVVQMTRPYRAFIEDVNDAGQSICLVKYVPPKDA